MKKLSVDLKPIFTERTLSLASKGYYTFEVNPKVDKGGIRKAVKDLMGISVKEVKVLLVKGIKRRVGRKRIEVKEKTYKKAVITLPKGQKIDLFEMEKETSGKKE